MPRLEPVSRREPMTVLFSARTDTGRVRSTNEDHFLVDRRLRLYVVCDGLGGHQGGEIASSIAVNAVRDALLRKKEVLEGYDFGVAHHDEGAVLALLREAVREANARIYERAQHSPSQRGMGTTLSLLVIARDRGFVAHVGDTRIYRLRAGQLRQVTVDHSLLTELRRDMNMTPRQIEALDPRLKNQITRAVGVHDSVEVDAFEVELQPGDRFLLCSDGLHGLIEDAEIAVELGHQDLVEAAVHLIDRANAAGGRDNITAIVVQLEPPPAAESPRRIWPLFEAVRAALLFQGLSDLELTRVLDGANVVGLAASDVLVREAAAMPGLFIVVEGELQVLRQAEVIAVLRQGDYFSEDALFLERQSGTTIIANGEGARVVVVDRRHFEELQRTAPTIALKLALSVGRSLARKVEATVREGGATRVLFKDPGAMTRPVPRPPTSPRVLADTEPEPRSRIFAHVDPADLTDRGVPPPPMPATVARRPRAESRRVYSAVTQPAIPVVHGPISAEIPVSRWAPGGPSGAVTGPPSMPVAAVEPRPYARPEPTVFLPGDAPPPLPILRAALADTQELEAFRADATPRHVTPSEARTTRRRVRPVTPVMRGAPAQHTNDATDAGQAHDPDPSDDADAGPFADDPNPPSEKD